MNKFRKSLISIALSSAIGLSLTACFHDDSDDDNTTSTHHDDPISIVLEDSQVISQNAFSETETGAAALTLHSDEGELEGSVTFAGTAPTALHVHQGFAGQTGAPVITLVQSATDSMIWNISDDQKTIDPDILNAGGYYLNAHFGTDADSPTLRAQIVNHDMMLSFAPLVEHNNVVSTGGGFAGITINEKTLDIVAYISITDLAANTGVHLHIEDENGDTTKKYELVEVTANDNTFYKIADDTKLTAELLANIKAGHWYINIHTTDNTGGELIGYLDNPHNHAINLTLDASQVINPDSANSTDTGTASLVFDTVTEEISGVVTMTGEEPSVIHIHSGFAGQSGAPAITLVKSTTDSTKWAIAEADANLLDADILIAGGYYLNAHLANNTLRAQIISHGTEFRIAALEASTGVTTAGDGFAGITLSGSVDENGDNLVRGYVTTTGLTDIADIHLHVENSASETVQLIALEVDTGTNYRIPVGSMLTSEALMDVAAGRWYINVHTAANPAGEMRANLDAIQ